jgi:hypothetical protein
MKLVLIEWVDSHSGRGWQDIGKLKEATAVMHCRSVGWVVAQDKNSVVVVPHLNGDEEGGINQGCGELSIPKRAIIRTTTLKY